MPTIAQEIFEKGIENYQKDNQFNANVLIAREDNILFQKSIGYADLEHKIPLDINTVFPIASISKQFTAVAILILHEQGKIDLHIPISHYLPKSDSLWQGAMPEWADRINIHQLLTHTSGLVSFNEMPDSDLKNKTHIIPKIISHISKEPLQSEPGKAFHYSNSGYLIAGIIIEKITEKSLNTFLNEMIFQPLGMSKTFMPTLSQEIDFIYDFPINTSSPVLYTALFNQPNLIPMRINQPFKVPYQGGAAIFSTLDDLHRWYDGLFHQKLISQESLNLMLTPHIEINDELFGHTFYGYGIFVDNEDDAMMYSHGGWIEGVRAMACYAPLKRTLVIVLSNISPNENQPETVQTQQANAFNDLAYELNTLARNT